MLCDYTLFYRELIDFLEENWEFNSLIKNNSQKMKINKYKTFF